VGVVQDPVGGCVISRYTCEIVSVDGIGASIPRRPPIWKHSGASKQETAMPADNDWTLARNSCLWSQDRTLYSMVLDCLVGAICDMEVCESVRRRGRLGVCHGGL